MNRTFVDRYAPLGAYLLVVIVGIAGFISLGRQSDARKYDRDRQTYELCIQGKDTRDGVRDSIRGVKALGLDLISGNPDSSRKTAAIEKINRYESEQLAKYPVITCPVEPVP